MCLRSTEPPLLPNPCYRLAFLSVVGYNHFYVVRLCHLSSAFLAGLCVGCFIFFEALEKYFETLFRVGEVEALLQFLVCALVCANCKCAYTCAMDYSFVKKSAISSACFKTVSIALACLSGG
jgi:hypothetical protein